MDLIAHAPEDAMTRSYWLFAKMIHEGANQPLSDERALRGFEVVMAVYESEGLRQKIKLPLQQELLPLEVMLAKE